ncbi:MAG: hypothetical protein QM817_03410 [Archangium sp.]
MKIDDKKPLSNPKVVKSTSTPTLSSATTKKPAAGSVAKKFGSEFSTGAAKALRLAALKGDTSQLLASKLAQTAAVAQTRALQQSSTIDPVVAQALEATRNGSDIGYYVTTELNPTQAAQYVAELAKNPETSDMLLEAQNPNGPFGYGYSPQEGEAISAAMGNAFKQGLITTGTLDAMVSGDGHGIIDVPNRPMRLAALLSFAPANSARGGINEAYGQELLKLADSASGDSQRMLEAAGCLLMSTSRDIVGAHPELANRVMDGVLTMYESGFPGELLLPEAADLLKERMLRGAFNVFMATDKSGKPVFDLDAATLPGGQTDLLQRFFKDVYFNPDIANLTGGPRQTMGQAIDARIARQVNDWQARMAGVDQNDREEIGRQMGTLVASVVAGAVAGTIEERDRLKADAEARRHMAGLITGVLTDLLPSGGAIIDAAVGELVDGIINSAIKDGKPSEQDIRGILSNFETQLRDFEEDKGYENIVTSFDAGFATTLSVALAELLER